MEQLILGYVSVDGVIYPYTDIEENGYLTQDGNVDRWIDKRRCEVTLKPEEDKINPAHYKTGGIETIDFILAKTANLPGDQAYLVGNIIKYISRYDKKNGVEDLKKADWYNDRLIKLLGNK